MSEMAAEIQRRKQQADYYYDNFVKHHRLGDLGKASEFLWGVVNNLTYSLGLLDGQRLGEHKKVVDYLNLLAGARQDREMAEAIIAAERLHANFFHAFMSRDMFDVDREKVEALVSKLAALVAERLKQVS